MIRVGMSRLTTASLLTVHVLCLLLTVTSAAPAADSQLRIATFQIDATPPLGTPLCDALVEPAKSIHDSLSARGIVMVPDGALPIVLVAVDWVGIGNEGHDAWREAIAEAVGTSAERVSVHTLHQHDAPGCDFLAERIAARHGLSGKLFDVEFARKTIARAARAAGEAMTRTRPVTHVGFGKAKVEKVASTRRLLGPDGKVQYVRYTSCRDPHVRALPEGTIDPYTIAVSFWDEHQPLVVLTYYATHPQSYYGQGDVSADFVGLARSMREEELAGVPHIHFNGAGGNIGAGKYNDGSPENRPLLARRLADGMAAAWKAMDKFPIENVVIQWDTRGVVLPLSEQMDTVTLQKTLEDAHAPEGERLRAARDLAWAQRCGDQHEIIIGRLRIGPVDLLHLPGELFVEYQLAAQQLRPDSLVCTAAYGDYGPGYIGLSISYAQGGYETSRVSRVSPRVEPVLINAIADLMR